ncbi:anthranilate synthase component I [Tautonia sociabilis]|uniref:Anthranilate synthase component 1 n=1 Tax=Tautonia sociabilis TaxID=2080755 RepID=A0A432MGX9_9BACT|nr:anthranilate synthase component I [Tautonia sociabilis]RUL85908.1 anthranilate synthase component I [Tautonia sociabilis]
MTPPRPSRPILHPGPDRLEAIISGAPGLPVYRELTADGLTPVSAFARIARPGPSFLFESVVGGEKVGRYSFLGTEPFLRFEARGNRVSIFPNDDITHAWEFESPDPFHELRTLVLKYGSVHLPGLPRFCGGAVGFASYDAVRYTERLPDAPPDDRGLPDLAFNFYDRMVIFDHIRKTVLVVAQARPEHPGEADARAAYEQAAERLEELVARLSGPGPELPPVDIDTSGEPSLKPSSNMTREEFENAVRRCREYIKAGDVFQVVPSQRFRVETTAEPFDIYRALRVVNPSPFLFYLPFQDFCLIGSSPEILVRVEDGEVTIRPLAGTRKRGKDEQEDLRLAEELLADPKERAEHVMLIDLGRNDVGRVAERASVRLTEVMAVERYSHVMHISSNVVGRLEEGKDCFDALRAGLPAGTVSGAPKVRAMEIIDEVEPTRRGPYGGAVGYIDSTGNMDTCIALRTLVVRGNTADIQAGAGIVFDSDPATEYEETVSKARGMLKAIELAQDRLTPARCGREAPRRPSK